MRAMSAVTRHMQKQTMHMQNGLVFCCVAAQSLKIRVGKGEAIWRTAVCHEKQLWVSQFAHWQSVPWPCDRPTCVITFLG